MRKTVVYAALACLVLGLLVSFTASQERKLNVIVFGAHPDDADGRAGGVAAKWAALGHKVQLVSVTNGDAGHQSEGGGALAKRRRAEAAECGRRLGVEYVTYDNHDGELLPTLEVRQQIIRAIRKWNADLVIGPRPNDYHPDHRYTGVLLQDAAYMVTVPNVCPDTPALRKNPVFMYSQDGFQKPNPVQPGRGRLHRRRRREEAVCVRCSRLANVRVAGLACAAGSRAFRKTRPHGWSGCGTVAAGEA